jgi:hypothetical protein
MAEKIRPGIVDQKTGETIYPTGDEWLLAFAIRGCRWAVDAIERKTGKKLDEIKVGIKVSE